MRIAAVLLILIALVAAVLPAQILGPILDTQAVTLTLTATTTGAQTVTIQELGNPVACQIDWGDGTVVTHAANTATTVSRAYAGAGTYNIKISNAHRITRLDLRDAKLGGLNTAQLRRSPITYFFVTAITGSTIRSSDMSAWRPAYWYLYSMPAGTYSIASADMAAWTTAQYVFCYDNSGLTLNVASGFSGMVAIRDLRIYSAGLTEAQVDSVLSQIYAAKATYTYATPMLQIGGTNAAPSGIYQAACPPTSGKEAVYELVNGACTAAGPEWTITFTP